MINDCSLCESSSSKCSQFKAFPSNPAVCSACGHKAHAHLSCDSWGFASKIRNQEQKIQDLEKRILQLEAKIKELSSAHPPTAPSTLPAPQQPASAPPASGPANPSKIPVPLKSSTAPPSASASAVPIKTATSSSANPNTTPAPPSHTSPTPAPAGPNLLKAAKINSSNSGQTSNSSAHPALTRKPSNSGLAAPDLPPPILSSGPGPAATAQPKVSGGGIFFESNLVQKPDQHFIKSWLQGRKVGALLYRASADGFQSAIFHEKCDEQGPSLTIVRDSKGNLFGGFTSVSWTSPPFSISGEWQADPHAFLFTLKNSQGVKPSSFKIQHQQKAILCIGDYGPTFGDGFDLRIENNDKSHSFNKTVFNSFFNDSGKEFPLTGEKTFVVDDFEVWQIV